MTDDEKYALAAASLVSKPQQSEAETRLRSCVKTAHGLSREQMHAAVDEELDSIKTKEEMEERYQGSGLRIRQKADLCRVWYNPERRVYRTWYPWFDHEFYIAHDREEAEHYFTVEDLDLVKTAAELIESEGE